MGMSNGQKVYYVIMDTSDEALSDSLGVNFAPKLANAIGTTGVQKVTMTSGGLVDFPGTVTFGQGRPTSCGPRGRRPPRPASSHRPVDG